MTDNKKNNYLELPPDKLPDYWNDNTRMNALFAPFRSRSVNPDDWDFKQDFWKKMINTWCTHYKRCYFTTDDLNKAFRRNNCPPGCLVHVVEEMNRIGETQTLSQFSSGTRSSWTGWAVDLLVKKPLYWSYNKIKESIISPSNENTVYINLKVIHNLSEEIICKVNEHFHYKVFELNKLINLLEHEGMDKNSIKYCIQCLCKEKKIVIEQKNLEINGESGEFTLLKLVDLKKKNDTIRDIDRAVFLLEENEKHLTDALVKLEQEKDSLIIEAKTYLKKGMKTMAKNCLRKKHAIEKCIEKRANVLENVQVLLAQVSEAECNTEILNAYRKGADALKHTYKNEGISEDTVSDLIVEVQDVLETQDDIQNMLGQSISSFNDSELEEELAELLSTSTITSPSTLKDLSVVEEPKTNLNEYEDIERRLKNLRVNSPVLDKEKMKQNSVA